MGTKTKATKAKVQMKITLIVQKHVIFAIELSREQVARTSRQTLMTKI